MEKAGLLSANRTPTKGKLPRALAKQQVAAYCNHDHLMLQFFDTIVVKIWDSLRGGACKKTSFSGEFA
jgi:hypothetical protein